MPSTPYYHRLDLPKMTVYLTSDELNRLLLKDMELFKRGLQRGKVFKRTENRNERFEKKYSEYESQKLNDHLH